MTEVAVPSGHAVPRYADLDVPVSFYYPYGVRDDTDCDALLPFNGQRAGDYVWTVKTYAQLRRIGFPCRLTDRLPREGIVLAHRTSLPNDAMPNERQLFVCIVAEYHRHPLSQLHVVQNPADPMLLRASPGWPATFMPHWPEYGLQPRDAARGDAFANVAYFGEAGRLAPQLRSEAFVHRLQAEGFDFRIPPREQWNDYRDIDAVLAVRSFAPVSFHKFPPSKLFNSWLAGVPALLGHESAYQAMRRDALDYFEVGSSDEIVRTLVRLRDDAALRREVAVNAARRARDLEAAFIAARWARFLRYVAVPAWHRWRERPAWTRRSFVAARELGYTGAMAVDVVRRGGGYVRKRWWAATSH